MRFVFVVLLAALSLPDAFAQTGQPALQPAEPYTDAEFDPLLLKLRRAEIIAIGAFPLAYLFSGLGYDYYYYLSNGYPQENIPWPAGPGTSRWVATTQPDAVQRKNLALVGISLAAGLLIAGLDWWLGE